MSPNHIKEMLLSEACRISKAASGTTWYIFGSFLRHPNGASDVDVLVRCDTHETAKLTRQEAANLCVMAPVHLLLLTIEEETEIGFIEAEGCKQFYPALQTLGALPASEA